MSDRGVWVLRNGELILRHLAPPLHAKHATSAYVIGDNLDYVVNHADGQRYTSKSAYYKAVRRKGFEIVGNERPAASPKNAMSDPGEDIKHSLEVIESRTPTPRRKRKNV